MTHIRWDNGGGGDMLVNDLRVDFVVRLPKRLRFIGRTVDGEVSAHMLEQDVEAHSVLGDVNVDLERESAARKCTPRAPTAGSARNFLYRCGAIPATGCWPPATSAIPTECCG